MVQLKVYDGSDQYFLDLLSNDPIKLTLSIEDITNTDARSTFSRTFRVPSTKNNNTFFKNAFLVDGIDYDVTVKKRAEILYNGAEYKVGHIRLQKIYHNKMERSTEYEIVFLGETRDFASALGEKTLAELDLSDYNHVQSYATVTQSWQAYPEGGVNDGLFNGDILYPLVNFGDVAGQNKITYGESNSFDQQNHPIYADRFKPMIRAKALWDKIFEEAGFEYESQIADSTDFRQLYISAWGNDAESTQTPGSANLLEVSLVNDQQISSGPQTIEWDDVLLDPSNNFNTSTHVYVAPITPGIYDIEAQIEGFFSPDLGYSAAVTVTLMDGPNVLSTWTSPSSSSGNTAYYRSINQSFNIINGNVFWLIDGIGQFDRGTVSSTSYFWVINAPGEIGIAPLLDSEYKQIDFVKDMLTKFRLVMAPDKVNPKKFIVEPWVDYIASGDIHDWSDKLDESRDIQIEPLFFTQSARLKFEDKEDKDWINDLNLKKFKETFGTLFIDSGNELLKDTREVKTNFAPTPMTQIEGASNSNFLIPMVHLHETGDAGNVEHIPIKAITRILFYNGLFTQSGFKDQGGGTQPIGDWYLFNEATASSPGESQFPMVSYWQNFDAVTGPNAATINMNWQIEPGYANPYASFNYEAGQSMYTRFWKDYIDSIYSKYARRVTAYFTLSVEDLFNFSFDDVIFVNGTYYRPEKITDVVVGQRSLVKVDLIKLLDYGLE